jgi:tRNA/rRNA methyltransferase
MDPRNIRLVLHRPQSADNLGAAARVLKNFALLRLVVVAPPAWAGPPRGGGPGTARDDVLRRARTLARRASDLLDTAEIHADLRAALGASTWVCGTTSRGIEGRPRLDPRQLAAELARRSADGEVAIVFGEERRGLSDAELELCQAVCTIPTDAAYDSMNLAQAVAVVAYELRMAGGGAAALGDALPGRADRPRVRAGAEPARHATVEALWGKTQTLLERAGYLNPQNPEHILADFRRLLARAEPTQREVELLVAAMRALERMVR